MRIRMVMEYYVDYMMTVFYRAVKAVKLDES